MLAHQLFLHLDLLGWNVNRVVKRGEELALNQIQLQQWKIQIVCHLAVDAPLIALVKRFEGEAQSENYDPTSSRLGFASEKKNSITNEDCQVGLDLKNLPIGSRRVNVDAFFQ